MKIAILIPAYNAGSGIREIVRQCLEVSPRVVVVDDGSMDDTGSWARQAGAEVVRHPQNRGKGAALRAGFDILLEEGSWDAILTLDADGQHDPLDIPGFLEAAKEGRAGILIGSRRAHMRGMRKIRRIFNQLSTWCIAGLCRQDIEDTQSGYRLIRTDLLRRIRPEGKRFELEADLLIQASRAGFSIVSIPISSPFVDGLLTSHYWPFRDSFLIGLLILRRFLGR